MLSLTISTTVDGFFDEQFLVRNLALLLQIPMDIINVIRESQRRRRKRQLNGGNMETIDIEIGNPPAPASPINTENETATDTTDTSDTLTFSQ